MFLSYIHPVHLVKSYGPGLIGVLTGLEAMGIPVPAESALIVTAIYAGHTGQVSITWLIVAAATGAIMGDNIGFIIGRTLGIRALHRWGGRVGLTEDRILLGRYLFHRHGGKVVFLGRFLGVLRTFAAVLAGAHGMEWRRFMVANASGGIVWACGYGLGAYWLGDLAKRYTGPFAITGAVVAVAVIVGSWIIMRRHEAELLQRARLAMAEDHHAGRARP